MISSPTITEFFGYRAEDKSPAALTGVLARFDGKGDLKEFTAIEVQTIDTTNSYATAQKALKKDRTIVADTVGLCQSA